MGQGPYASTMTARPCDPCQRHHGATFLDRDEIGAPTENLFCSDNYDKIAYRTEIGRYAATGLESLLCCALSSLGQMNEVRGCSVQARRRLFAIRALYPRVAAALLTAQSNHCVKACRIYQTTTNGTSVLVERTASHFVRKVSFESEDTQQNSTDHFPTLLATISADLVRNSVTVR